VRGDDTGRRNEEHDPSLDRPRSPRRRRSGLTILDTVDRGPADPKEVTDLRNGHVLLRN
jgi:hypothetical protein